MEIKLAAIGGYGEVGKNMTALKINNDVIILDMGVYVPKLVDFEEEGFEKEHWAYENLLTYGAIPNDRVIEKWKTNVKAIIASHCHLDHCAAIPYTAPRYNCPIIATPFTIEVIKTLLKDEQIKINNQLKPLNTNSFHKISKDIEVEFIHVNHSTLQTVLIVLHTKEGAIVYANDFKLDNNPVMEKPTNYKRLRQIGDNCLALITDSLYSWCEGKTPSELVAREMLKDVMLGTNNQGNAIIVTTFASHIPRLKSIVEFGKKLNRKVVFLGRSLAKYNEAAQNLGLIKFDDVKTINYKRDIKKFLKKAEKEGRGKYLIVCTGNQGEPRAVLTRMAKKDLPFRFLHDDHVIFACKTIPVNPNLKNRAIVEELLKRYGVRIFKDIHVSGHIASQDMIDMIKMLEPKYLVPIQGNRKMIDAFAEVAYRNGYSKKEVLLMHDGGRVNLI